MNNIEYYYYSWNWRGMSLWTDPYMSISVFKKLFAFFLEGGGGVKNAQQFAGQSVKIFETQETTCFLEFGANLSWRAKINLKFNICWLCSQRFNFSVLLVRPFRGIFVKIIFNVLCSYFLCRKKAREFWLSTQTY